jgi:transcriptional regulator with XRE-family HTH domain
MTFKQFLEMKFLEWQQQAGSRKTAKEFAEYLGVGQTTISSWWNANRKPEGENLVKLSKRFGIEVYDVLGLPRPNENLSYLQRIWDDLPPEQQSEVVSFVNKLKARNERNQKNKTAMD